MFSGAVAAVQWLLRQLGACAAPPPRRRCVRLRGAGDLERSAWAGDAAAHEAVLRCGGAGDAAAAVIVEDWHCPDLELLVAGLAEDAAPASGGALW